MSTIKLIIEDEYGAGAYEHTLAPPAAAMLADFGAGLIDMMSVKEDAPEIRRGRPVTLTLRRER